MLVRRKRSLSSSKLMLDNLSVLLTPGCDLAHERFRTSRNSLPNTSSETSSYTNSWLRTVT